MSSFAKATGRTIQQAFDQYHRLNPGVYEQCRHLALDAIRRGRKRISFKLIINVIRWERFLKTEDPVTVEIDGEPKQFKINDAYSSRYARLFRDEYPEHAELIEFRELRSVGENMDMGLTADEVRSMVNTAHKQNGGSEDAEPYVIGDKTKTCSKCKAEIIWLEHIDTGKRAPIDAAGTPDGNIVINRADGLYRMATENEKEVAKIHSKKLYQSHFAVCPNAKDFKT